MEEMNREMRNSKVVGIETEDIGWMIAELVAD